jgi:hypothetical protein
MIRQYIYRHILASMAFACVLMQAGCATGLRGTAGVDHLLLQIQSNRSKAQVGLPIQIQFTITNTDQSYIVVESTDTAVLDIVVQVVGGPNLFVWSSQNPDKIAHRLEWKPGESKTIELIWIPRPEDIASGYYKDVFLGGLLYKDGEILQGANVQICASNYCR